MTSAAPNGAASNEAVQDPVDSRDARHLVLVGLMGTGKSTVGRLLAHRLARPLIDTDDEVERRAGRSVREIFASDGEEEFRRLERDVLADALADPTPSVVAAAGGVVLSQENRGRLRTSPCRVVWLRASPRALVPRVRGGGHRPLLDADPESTLVSMAETREALYREVADLTVDVEAMSPAEVVEAVLR